MSKILKPGSLSAVIVLACMIGGVGSAPAAVGITDSPLFSLNTAQVSGADDNLQPYRDYLGGCYPNPFNPQTTINFELATRTVVDLRVYDLQGRLVRVLTNNELMNSGTHQTAWDGRDARGGDVAAGIYLYRLVTDNFVGSRRMTLLK